MESRLVRIPRVGCGLFAFKFESNEMARQNHIPGNPHAIEPEIRTLVFVLNGERQTCQPCIQTAHPLACGGTLGQLGINRQGSVANQGGVTDRFP